MNSQFKANKLHLLFLSLLAIHYIVPLILVGQVTINPHDNLDGGFVFDHVISRIYRGDFESINNFLSGNIKWYYIEELFYPINILHYFLNDKLFYFSDEILKKIFAYFSFYLLSKSLGNSKFNSGLGAVLYSAIINKGIPLGFGLSFLPYMLYLLIKKKSLNKKHYFCLFLIGLNSSLIQDAFVFIFLIPLSFILLNNRKNLNIFFQVILTVVFASILSNIHLIIGSIFFEPIHRGDWISGNKMFFPFITAFQRFFTYEDPTSPLIAFNIPLIFLTGLTFFISFFSKNKKIKLITFFIIFILITKSLLDHSIIDNVLIGVLEILKGYNFQRLVNIIPLVFALLFVYFISDLKYSNLKKFFYTLAFVSIISLQLKTPLPIIAESFLNSNMNLKEYNKSKNYFLNKKYNYFFAIILNKENYNTKKIDLKYSVTKTFDNYYRFDDYAFIKNIVKNQRVMSVGIDPMIAVMNDIKVIDGYHNVYPLSYKIKFRKIIEKELEKNDVLKSYYDSWGNRIYAFYTDKNNLVLNFKYAKTLGANFIISKFVIENSELEEICANCNNSNNIFLYKIL